jgi:electron transfer flavoprotein beta subunit
VDRIENGADMKILVCISHVPDTTAKINFSADGSSLVTDGMAFVINPNDEFGLARAMQLKESDGADVTVVNVGESHTEPTLRKALAIGADRAIRIDAAPVDASFVAAQLAHVIKDGGYDLIITGTESIDYNGNQVHAMISMANGLPLVYPCVGLQLDGTKATAIREIDGGKETVETTLALIVAGKKGLVEESDLRIPNMRGIMMARSKPLEVLAPVDGAQRVSVATYEKPAERGQVAMFDNVQDLVKALHQDAKII